MWRTDYFRGWCVSVESDSRLFTLRYSDIWHYVVPRMDNSLKCVTFVIDLMSTQRLHLPAGGTNDTSAETGSKYRELRSQLRENFKSNHEWWWPFTFPKYTRTICLCYLLAHWYFMCRCCNVMKLISISCWSLVVKQLSIVYNCLYFWCGVLFGTVYVSCLYLLRGHTVQ